jgi:glyoxylase-like metal-dependent hydrolase (beta-lactamase superfamily II)
LFAIGFFTIYIKRIKSPGGGKLLLYQDNGVAVSKTKTSRCGCYVLSYENRCVLVDTSVRRERRRLEGDIGDIGLKPDAILLTHSHSDHAANARYYAEIYQCPVYVSEHGQAAIKAGVCTMPKGTRQFSRLVCFLESILPSHVFRRFDSFPAVKQLTPEVVQLLLGSRIRMMETPGHSDDSISLIIDNRIAIIGDTAVNMGGRQYPPFADDTKALLKSWEQLLETGAEIFCPAHGKPFVRDTLLREYRKAKA